MKTVSKLEAYQSKQQALRSGFNINDYLQTFKTVTEKCHKYKQPLAMSFVDFEKSFDCVELWSLITALKHCIIDK